MTNNSNPSEQEPEYITHKDKLKHAITKQTDNTWLQIVRYAFVSVAAAIVDWGIFAILTWFLGDNHKFLGIEYKFYFTTISSLMGGLVNYSMSKIWVFHQTNINNKVMEFAAFTAIGGVGLILNIITLWFFSNILYVNPLISKIFSIIVVFFSTFFIRKYLLFTNKK